MTIISDIFRTLENNASRVALAAGLAGAIGLAAPAVSFAQDSGPRAEQGEQCDHGRRGHRRGGRRGHHMRRMAAELELTDAQREQIREIFQEARGQRGENARGENGRAERGAMRRQVHERIQAVLTPAQRQRAQELRAEHGQRRLDRRVERMTERLALSERQQQQVRGIMQNAGMQGRILREQGADDPASTREAMRGLRERTQAAIRSVLSSEQQSQLDEMRARRGERRGRGHGRGHGPRGAR